MTQLLITENVEPQAEKTGHMYNKEKGSGRNKLTEIGFHRVLYGLILYYCVIN